MVSVIDVAEASEEVAVLAKEAMVVSAIEVVDASEEVLVISMIEEAMDTSVIEVVVLAKEAMAVSAIEVVEASEEVLVLAEEAVVAIEAVEEVSSEAVAVVFELKYLFHYLYTIF